MRGAKAVTGTEIRQVFAKRDVWLVCLGMYAGIYGIYAQVSRVTKTQIRQVSANRALCPTCLGRKYGKFLQSVLFALRTWDANTASFCKACSSPCVPGNLRTDNNRRAFTAQTSAQCHWSPSSSEILGVLDPTLPLPAPDSLVGRQAPGAADKPGRNARARGPGR